MRILNGNRQIGHTLWAFHLVSDTLITGVTSRYLLRMISTQSYSCKTFGVISFG